MFVRDFQALVVAAICFAKGYLVMREAVEGIECLQESLSYRERMMRHTHD